MHFWILFNMKEKDLIVSKQQSINFGSFSILSKKEKNLKMALTSFYSPVQQVVEKQHSLELWQRKLVLIMLGMLI